MGLADTTIHLPSSPSSSFFDPSILPSLRQLRLGCIYLEGRNSLPGDHNDDGGGTVFSPALIRQLDQLHLELSSVCTLCDGVGTRRGAWARCARPVARRARRDSAFLHRPPAAARPLSPPPFRIN